MSMRASVLPPFYCFEAPLTFLPVVLCCRWSELVGDKEGFYRSLQPRNGKHNVILAIEIEDGMAKKKSILSSANAADAKRNRKENILFQVYHPNTGLQFKHESLAELEKRYVKVLSTEAEPHWTQLYDASVNTCSHSYWKGHCRNVSLGQECEVRTSQRGSGAA